MVLKTSDIADNLTRSSSKLQQDRQPLRARKENLGSARVSRAGFGVAPKRTFLLIPIPERIWKQWEKSANPRRDSPARGTRALPRSVIEPLLRRAKGG